MRLYRVAQERYAADLSGKGAELYGGRWTPAGYPVIYTAEHPALAGFEKLVHTGIDVTKAPMSHRLVVIDVPDVAIERIAHVPDDPVEVGRAWLDAGGKPLLQVPSVVVPYAWNYLINVRHRAMAEITVSDNVAFVLDRRIGAGAGS
jgi:RES domain-containing protein